MTVLAISPHLDDAAFSAGGALALLAASGRRVVMATVFTQSVVHPTGFALACQTDKGLGPEVDYMALRRAEDVVAAAALGVETRWLDLPEAPHRGYASAAALFGGVNDADTVWQPLAERLRALVAELSPGLLLTCQGLGGHVDHLQTIRAVQQVADQRPVGYWQDMPYLLRDPAAQPFPEVPEVAGTVDIAAALPAKIAACTAYTSQLGFQFGGAPACAAAIAAAGTVERYRGAVPG